MSLRLANRNNGIPNGFLYHQRETNWSNWQAQPQTMWDFKLLCKEIQKHRQLNPRFRLNTDLVAIANEVDRVNAERMAMIPNAQTYYIDDASPALPMNSDSPPNPQVPPPSSSLLDAAGAALAKMASGVGVLYDWLGSGGTPVDNATAEARAQICAVCPRNGKGGLSRFFTEPAAALITKQLEQRKDLNLSTSVDDKLGICEACGCVNKLKVHVPIEYILAKMSEQVRADLDKSCWILKA